MTKTLREGARTDFRRFLFVLSGAALALADASVGHAQKGDYEKSEPRQTRDVAPAVKVESPLYRLAPTVRTHGYLDNFVVTSEYGAFEAKSDAMMRRLDREIGAIAALRKITSTDAFAKALEQSAKGALRGAEALVEKPVETVKAVPQAVFNVFSRAKQGVETAVSGQKTEYEDSSAAAALQMSSYKRDYAKSLGVDPYSTNPILQKELDSVAWAAAAGGLTVSGASMMSGSAVVSTLSTARSLDQALAIVAAEPPPELMKRNKAALQKMQIKPALAQKFLEQKNYSPRAKTILVMSLAAMPEAKGKDAVLDVALGAPDEVTAIFYQQLAEMLNGYDDRVARITQLQRRNRIVIARDKSGKSVVLLPIDYAIWDEQAASAAQEIAKSRELKPGGNAFELWIAGKASPRFKSEAKALGIDVKETVVAQLPLID